MSYDLFGPASVGATTTRPDDERTFGATDTWWKDCSSPEAEDGTLMTASWLNQITAQFRRAIRGMGVVPEDNHDDDLLLKAIQKASSTGAVLQQTATVYLDLYPVIRTASNKMSVTASPGQVVIASGQSFVRRGVFPYNTTDYTAEQRTFATLANQTYHLRWTHPGGNAAHPGVFALKNVSDVGYNPGSAVEANPVFDSGYDDMLIARVVTNGANVPTVTALVNRQDLRAQQRVRYDVVPHQITWSAMPDSAFELNWARTPTIADPVLRLVAARQSMPNGIDAGGGALMLAAVRSPSGGVTRYGAPYAEFAYDDEENNLGAIEFNWQAIA